VASRRDPGGGPVANPVTLSVADSVRLRDGNADRNRDSHRHGNGNRHGNRDSDSNRDTYGHGVADGHGNRVALAIPLRHGDQLLVRLELVTVGGGQPAGCGVHDPEGTLRDVGIGRRGRAEHGACLA
jgi:hypothetical protein